MPVSEVPELYVKKNVCKETMVVVRRDRNCVSFYVDDGDEGKEEEDVLLLSFLKSEMKCL